MHPDAGRRARSIRTLAGSSDWRRSIIDRLGSAAVFLAGPRVGPVAANGWPWPPIAPGELVAMLSNDLPGLRLVAAAAPRQAARKRLSLLCRYAGNTIVVKLGVDEPDSSLANEAAALTALRLDPLPGIATPNVIASGQLPMSDGGDSIRFLATEALGLDTQRPAIDVALRTFESDLAKRLRDALPRPTTAITADHHREGGLVPTHGDLTPWNLRRSRRGLALFDWEAVGWGRPGSDLAHYRHACNEVRPTWRSHPRESDA
jgi:hypothetical protein